MQSDSQSDQNQRYSSVDFSVRFPISSVPMLPTSGVRSCRVQPLTRCVRCSAPAARPVRTHPSPKLLFSFYRRSDKVLGMNPPPDFAIVATLSRPIHTEGSHFRAILHSLSMFALPTMPATAELGTQLEQVHPPNLCSPSIEGLTKFGG